ncbi:hypothetical protein [Alicyclobacillus dauci]|uniref:Signal peptide containing protein n=1 Tax=Alicyclobacillus dauci TaxID=1475485 RepID=A0ABY6Z9V3_9BACL|nr:hypothetical protein [Alicyclobacillus dauci]WAH39036.1 hypothetical protein NZD86_11420 [Alicyclobacillus dauci]
MGKGKVVFLLGLSIISLGFMGAFGGYVLFQFQQKESTKLPSNTKANSQLSEVPTKSKTTIQEVHSGNSVSNSKSTNENSGQTSNKANGSSVTQEIGKANTVNNGTTQSRSSTVTDRADQASKMSGTVISPQISQEASQSVKALNLILIDVNYETATNNQGNGLQYDGQKLALLKEEVQGWSVNSYADSKVKSDMLSAISYLSKSISVEAKEFQSAPNVSLSNESQNDLSASANELNKVLADLSTS